MSLFINAGLGHIEEDIRHAGSFTGGALDEHDRDQAIVWIDSRKGNLIRPDGDRRKQNAKSAADGCREKNPVRQFHPLRASVGTDAGAPGLVSIE